MAVQKQDDQHEHTFSSYVRIQDVVLKTYLGRWTIGRSGERGSGISVLPARYDDDDDFLQNGLNLLHKCTPTKASDGVNQITLIPSRVFLSAKWTDCRYQPWTFSFLLTNYCLTRFTCILFLLLGYICFPINLFAFPGFSFVNITT